MKLAPFLLEHWIEEHQSAARYNLALSTGPKWTVSELRGLMSEAQHEAFETGALAYCPSGGRESLRAAIAAMYGADAEEVRIFTGSAEALLALFVLASEPGANVIVPWPAFAPFALLPEALGLEVRRYPLRIESAFDVDVDAVRRLADARTKLILMNTPHNPSGAVLAEDAVREIDAFARARGIDLVVDEVYHPIYHGEPRRSAADYSGASVLGDFSKAFSLPGVRIGWLLERDPRRRAALENARGYFTVSSSFLGEILAEVAAEHRETVWNRARNVSAANLAALAAWCASHEELLEWLRPHGAMTAFPRLRGRDDARPFCEAAAARGVLLAPGDCFGAPAHFRIGFGLEMPGYRDALAILSDVLVSLPPH